MINSNHASHPRHSRRAALRDGTTIVVDIGKTLSKVSLWSRDGRLQDRQTRGNALPKVAGIARLDAEGIGTWLIDAFGKYRGLPVETIIPVGHGAGVAVLVDGELAFAPLDYEQPLPPEVMEAYRRERDPFSLTGSPALPNGLNMGGQLFWLERLYPEAMRRAVLLPWVQYWAWFLAGSPVSEVTSFGCHSDLWVPGLGCFSPMARRLGWDERFAPLVPAREVIGTLRAEVAARTGIAETAQVLAGLHDSNAALLAARGFEQIAGQEATVLSTGTWFVAMRIPGRDFPANALPEARDCLVNVDVYGGQVPSARFMGGREIQEILGSEAGSVDMADEQAALLAAAGKAVSTPTMVLPTLAPGCGPFPDGQTGWVNFADDPRMRGAAACLYAALVADVSLGLIGARERLVIEGRFAQADLFVRALAALRPNSRVYVANGENDVSFGALRLRDPLLAPPTRLAEVQPLDLNLAAYRQAWLNAVAAAA